MCLNDLDSKRFVTASGVPPNNQAWKSVTVRFNLLQAALHHCPLSWDNVFNVPLVQRVCQLCVALGHCLCHTGHLLRQNASRVSFTAHRSEYADREL